MDTKNHAQKLLFICSQNRIRSLTAEHLYRGFPGYEAKSAGTEPGARIRVTAGLIGWADFIFVMEKRHARILSEMFGPALDQKRVICLRIDDLTLRYMEPALVDQLKAALIEHVEVPD